LQKVLLINLNTRWFGTRCWDGIPYGICILKAALKDKYNVKLLDANFNNFNEQELKDKILEYSPDVVGISCMSMEYKKSLIHTAQLVKGVLRDVPVVVGGIYPTLLPEEIICENGIDYVVMGEGEFRFDKLLQYLENKTFSIESIDGVAYKKNNGFIVQKVKYYIEDLDVVPFPDYSELDYQAYSSVATKYSHYTHPMRFPYGITITSRGCPFDCIFCSSKKINGKKLRFRSAKSVLDEIDWLVNEYGIKEIIFYDDNLIINRKRIVEILEGLIERNYDLQWKPTSIAVYALDDDLLELIRKSGCYQLVLALESGTEEGLKIIKKPFRNIEKSQKVVAKAKSLGFYLSANFVIGLPGETWEQILRTFHFAESLDIDFCTFCIATPLPKTELYEICKKNNLLVPNFSFNDESFTGFGRPSIRTSEFIPSELAVLRAFEWDRINFKTKKQIERIALMNGICVNDVLQWRINTRRNALDLIKKIH